MPWQYWKGVCGTWRLLSIKLFHLSYLCPYLMSSGDDCNLPLVILGLLQDYSLGCLGSLREVWEYLNALLEAHQSVQSLSQVRLFVTPWTAACQASLSITSSWSLLKLISIELCSSSFSLLKLMSFNGGTEML